MADKDQNENAPPAGGSKKILLALGLTNILTLGGLGYFVAVKGADSANAATEQAPEEEKVVPNEFEKELGPTVELGTFTINLADASQNRYLKAILKGSVNTEVTQEEVEAREPQIRDVIISYLSSLTVKETQGARAKATIRDNLRKRLNNILRTGEIEKIYLTEFVTQ